MSEKRVVRTEAAPAPFQGAPYSQAIAANGFVFVSGQLGLKPGDTAIAGGIDEQTEQAFANLKAILAEAGTGLDRLVKTTVFLQHLDDFQAMNEVYAKHVGEQPPILSAVPSATRNSGSSRKTPTSSCPEWTPWDCRRRSPRTAASRISWSPTGSSACGSTRVTAGSGS